MVTSQTYLLSDQMMALDKQIKDLNLSYLKDHHFTMIAYGKFGLSKTCNYFQISKFTLELKKSSFSIDREANLILKSDPDGILIEKAGLSFSSIRNSIFSMEDFLELITPDLAEVLYFNIDLWPKK